MEMNRLTPKFGARTSADAFTALRRTKLGVQTGVYESASFVQIREKYFYDGCTVDKCVNKLNVGVGNGQRNKDG